MASNATILGIIFLLLCVLWVLLDQSVASILTGLLFVIFAFFFFSKSRRGKTIPATVKRKDRGLGNASIPIGIAVLIGRVLLRILISFLVR